MKKIIVFSVVVATVLAFSACKKEGVYKPGRKISKVYCSSYETREFTDTLFVYEYPKELSEKWNWDGNLVKSIVTFYDEESNTIEFSYDGKRLVRADWPHANQYVEYIYDGRKLDKMEFYRNGSLVNECEVVHDGKKIKELKFLSYNAEKGGSIDNDMFDLALRMFMPNIESSKRIANAAKNGGKGIKEWSYSFEWTGDNISKLVRTGEDLQYEITYTYDDKKNPFKGFVYYLGSVDDIQYGSKNNYTRALWDDGDIFDYKYTYDGDWPTKVIEINNYVDDNSFFPDVNVSRTITYYYEYKD